MIFQHIIYLYILVYYISTLTEIPIIRKEKYRTKKKQLYEI